MTDKEREDLILVLQRILRLLEEERTRRQDIARRLVEALDNYATEASR